MEGIVAEYLPLLSGFFLPVAVAFLSAFFGARLANQISQKVARTQFEFTKLNATVLGISLSGSVCNGGIALKRQHILPSLEEFRKAQNTVYFARFMQGVDQEQVRVELELSTLSEVTLPVLDLVKHLTFELPNTSMAMQSVALRASYENVTSSLVERNKWIEEFRISDMSTEDKIDKYFGFPTDKHESDLRYTHILENLSHSLDDLIFHSYWICQKLTRQAIHQNFKFKPAFGMTAPSIPLLGFNDPLKKAFLPDFENYSDWLEKEPTLKKPWYESKRATRDKLLEIADKMLPENNNAEP